MSGPDDDPANRRPRSPAVTEAWVRTTEDMDAVAEDRRTDGWDVVAIPALHTSPVSEAQGDDDRFGLVHVVPDNYADEFREAFERGDFPRYQAYRNQVSGRVFLVTELVDPDSDTVILIAGQYEVPLARGMVQSALENEAIYTVAKTIDGTELGSVRHDEVEPFLPSRE